MRYVKIKAKNYNEAMMKLKMEHGDDAIPISHKYIKEGGLFNSGLFAKDLVELTAAIPERKSASKAKPEKKSTIDFTVGDSEPMRPQAQRAVTPEYIPPRSPEPVEKKPEFTTRPATIIVPPPAAEPRTAPEPQETAARPSDPGSMRTLEREFGEVKETLNRILETHTGRPDRERDCTSEEDMAIKPYMDMLLTNDFDRKDCESMIDEVRNSVSREDLRDKFKIEKTLKELIKSRIITSGPIKKGHKKKIIMFIGPTGVGKTTTMAKLGAIFALREECKVAFITIDNYRIAATEQLKKYAEIMKIPIHVVNDQKTFKETIDHEKAEIVMVDTSGRSHRNDLKISEIKSYADMVEYDFEKVLCVSACTKKADLANVFKSFDKISFDSVIITKVDETSYIGNVIDIADKYKKPISYITTGQEVPNDIDVADADKVAGMIMGAVI
jgi:flagellar biosynthesis protein FlhF